MQIQAFIICLELIALPFKINCRGPEGSTIALTIRSGLDIKHLDLTLVSFPNRSIRSLGL